MADDVQRFLGLISSYLSPERWLIAFDYHSPAHADGIARRHTVEPHVQHFDSTRTLLSAGVLA